MIGFIAFCMLRKKFVIVVRRFHVGRNDGYQQFVITPSLCLYRDVSTTVDMTEQGQGPSNNAFRMTAELSIHHQLRSE